MSDQMIFKRYEIKYMLTEQQLNIIKDAMANHMIVDEHGKSTICSLYFDTPDYRIIRHSLEHPVYKEKIRLRSYGVAKPNDKIFIELKKKYDGVVYKRRIECFEKDSFNLLSDSSLLSQSQIGREIDYSMHMYPGIAPSVLLTYEREAYYENNNKDFRITFDSNILWRDYDLNLHLGIYGEPILDHGKYLMEVKTSGSIPTWLVNILTANNIYKTSFSKYGNAYINIYNKNLNERIYNYA